MAAVFVFVLKCPILPKHLSFFNQICELLASKVTYILIWLTKVKTHPFRNGGVFRDFLTNQHIITGCWGRRPRILRVLYIFYIPRPKAQINKQEYQNIYITTIRGRRPKKRTVTSICVLRQAEAKGRGKWIVISIYCTATCRGRRPREINNNMKSALPQAKAEGRWKGSVISIHVGLLLSI